MDNTFADQCLLEELSVEDNPRPRKPILVSLFENIYAIHDIILSDCRIRLKHIAETLKIFYERVHHIIYVDLDMKKICKCKSGSIAFNLCLF